MDQHRSLAKGLRPLTGLALLGLLLGGLSAPPAARAANFVVTSTADSGPGSLREAMAAATASPGSDQITFNLAGCPCTIALASELEVPNGELKINGPGTGQLTLSGDGTVRVLRVGADASVDLQGVTIAKGNNADAGGGIVNAGTLVLRGSTVRGNTTPDGSGIANYGTLKLYNSTVSANTGAFAHGGGIVNYGTLTLERSAVSGNTGSIGIGGGIANHSRLVLSNSTISGNTALYRGGGIYNAGSLTLSNSTVSGNSVTSRGGGIYNIGTLMLSNSTISDNTAVEGGGIYNRMEYTTVQHLRNSIIANSLQGGDFFGNCPSSNVYTLIEDGSCYPLLAGDPQLGPLADNGGPTRTHALLLGSPAIDAGDPSGCRDTSGYILTTDQRGQPRPVDGDGDGSAVCDLGAYERSAVPVLRVLMDLKPGGADDAVNPYSQGILPVAILSNPEIDAGTIDAHSVRFGPRGAQEALDHGHLEDINGDGRRDLLLHFRTQDTGIQCGDNSASLQGRTFSGVPIFGETALRTVGCH